MLSNGRFKKQTSELSKTSTGSSASGINTLSNLGFTTTFKTVTREKAKIVRDHEKNLLEYLSDKVWNLINRHYLNRHFIII